jgi:hypothetical protein
MFRCQYATRQRCGEAISVHGADGASGQAGRTGRRDRIPAFRLPALLRGRRCSWMAARRLARQRSSARDSAPQSAMEGHVAETTGGTAEGRRDIPGLVGPFVLLADWHAAARRS